MKQQPLLFNTPTKTQSPGPNSSQDTSTQKIAPDTIMQPPIEGSNCLALNVATKSDNRELNKWINALSINEVKNKKVLHERLATVGKLVNTLDEDRHPQLRRVGVTCGIPTGMVNKMASPALAPILATASYMAR